MKKIMILLFFLFLLLIVSCEKTIEKTENNSQTSIEKQDSNKEIVETKKANDENKPYFIITSPKPGQTVGKAEFVLELKNTDYPKFKVFHEDKNYSKIGNSFSLDLEDGEHTVEIKLISRDKKELYSKNITFNVDSNKVEKVKEEPKAKDLLRKKTERKKEQVNKLSGEERVNSEEADKLGLDFKILLPTPGYNVKGNIIAVRLEPFNFTFGEIGSKHVPGQGYFRFKINDGEWFNVNKATKTIKGLDKGTNTLYVEMVRNDGTSYGIKKHVSFEAQTVTGKR